MSIALFFGSFNPIHIGHLVIAQAVLDVEEIEKVWFVVSPQNPFKKSQNLLDERQRYYLTQIAIEDNPKFYISNIEFSLPKPSYTIDTLAYLKEKYPDKSFSILMGGDNLEHFHKWKNHETILQNHKIYIYNRPKTDLTQVLAHEHIAYLDVPLMDISSTMIRNRIKNKLPIKYLVLEKVEEEIEKSRCYL